MRDHLNRQIQWYEQLLAELETLDVDIATLNPDELEARQRVRVNGTRILDEEFAILQREWQADRELSEAERAIMHELARRAEHLAAKLMEAHEKAMAAVNAKVTALKLSWNAARRGRDLLKHYHTGPSEGADYIDRKA